MELPEPEPVAPSDVAPTSAPEISDRSIPLVVDLDGTLIRTDLLVEAFLQLLAKDFWKAMDAVAMLRHGKAALKARLADEVMIEARLLPLDPAVVELIKDARGQGRKVYLASASNERYVRSLAEHLGWFEDVLGSTAQVNLSGRSKAEALVEMFGERGFDYVGNDRVDLHVWSRCRRAYAAGGGTWVYRRLRRDFPDAVMLPVPKGARQEYLKALRPHQWAKNILVAAPAAAGQMLGVTWLEALLAFIAFSLCASSVYITNDLLDLSADREHARKRRRPFASGSVPVLHGAVMAVALLAGAFAVTLFLPPLFVTALAAYFVLTLAYSILLKRKPVVDVIALACLYGLRVLAGGIATGTKLSPWLLGLATFLFLSLALVKRCAELIDRQKAGTGDPVGRGYRLGDIPALEAMAIGAGYNAALVLALYISDDAVGLLYSHSERLWLLCLLLLAWLSRIFLITRRGWMNDDPVVFALRDRWSLVIGLACAAVVMASR